MFEHWNVLYGVPKRPSLLRHFGHKRLGVDPSGMWGRKMMETVFSGLRLSPGDWVLDPCIGKGLTGRLAHRFSLNCFGSELDRKRLLFAVEWLRKRGYEIREVGCEGNQGRD